MEIWKPVKGYEGIYEISNLGNVRNLTTDTFKKSSKRIDGYYVVTLYKEGKQNTFLLHRLVGIAFIANKENKPQINHIDNNKANNNVSNLEWVTNSENQKHSYKNGKKPTINNKLNEQQVINIFQEYKKGKTSYKRLSIKYKVGKTTIENIIKRHNWKTLTEKL